MKIYNKLVRDNIPQIIQRSGKNFKIRLLGEEEYRNELRNKVVEEAKELNKARTKEQMIEELADLYELLDYVLMEEKIDLLEVKKKRIQKNMEKGSFEEGIYLESVSE